MMRQPSSRFTKIMLVAALVAATALAGATRAAAYTVVTRDGHVIQAQSRPEIRGLQAYMRLVPHGQLAVIQEEQIDWARTDAANPGPAVIALPSDARMTEGTADKPAPKPLEVKIVGSPSAKEGAGAPAADKTAEQKTPGEGTPESRKVNAQEAIIKLQKEYAQVAAARDSAAERKKTLETELAGLQSKQTGYASEETASAKRIRELQEQLAATSQEIDRCESRLNDIRAEASQLGGTID